MTDSDSSPDELFAREIGLDDGFVPASLWIDRYDRLAGRTKGSRMAAIDLLRAEGCGVRADVRLLPDEARWRPLNEKRMERLVKTLLWMAGGWDVRIENADELTAFLARTYAPDGARAFDNKVVGEQIYGHALRFRSEKVSLRQPPSLPVKRLGGQRNGCRIGFDLGGSDRKCAAVVDGRVVFSEEVPWAPYFEADPRYHRAGIADSIRRAAAHLPRIDAIGGSAAGVYIDNEPRIASLFRGVNAEDFDRRIRPIFKDLKKEWGGIPFEVANDGDVSALAGVGVLGEGRVLGLSLGTSFAAGYADEQGHLTGWLSELAFVPVDYGGNCACDEWSGDAGCAVQYFSQQGVQRLCRALGPDFSDAAAPAPEVLKAAQARLEAGDERALRLFESIGVRLGYTLPLYANFYPLKHVLLLGRVVGAKAGEVLTAAAQSTLRTHFPQLNITLHIPDETFRRHGQAAAAAFLPAAD